MSGTGKGGSKRGIEAKAPRTESKQAGAKAPSSKKVYRPVKRG